MKIWIELELDVEYDYSPSVEQTRTDPAWDAELTVTSVALGGFLLDALLPKDINEQILTACWDEVAMLNSKDVE